MTIVAYFLSPAQGLWVRPLSFLSLCSVTNVSQYFESDTVFLLITNSHDSTTVIRSNYTSIIILNIDSQTGI